MQSRLAKEGPVKRPGERMGLGANGHRSQDVRTPSVAPSPKPWNCHACILRASHISTALAIAAQRPLQRSRLLSVLGSLVAGRPPGNSLTALPLAWIHMLLSRHCTLRMDVCMHACMMLSLSLTMSSLSLASWLRCSCFSAMVRKILSRASRMRSSVFLAAMRNQ